MLNIINHSIQFSSVAQLCPTLCDPVNLSTPGFPVHHQLPEFTREMRIKSAEKRHFIPLRMAVIKMSTNSRCWRRCGEKRAILHFGWECKLVRPLWRMVWKFLKKPNVELPYDPVVLVLGRYLEKAIIWKDTCTPVLIAARFTTAKTWKQPKRPSAEEWIKKVWYIYIQWNISCKKEWNNAILSNMDTPWVETIILREVSQIKTNTLW